MGSVVAVLDPRWRALRTPTEVAAGIVRLYESADAEVSAVGREGVSSAEHALQTGSFALAAGADVALVVAAFLHDVGTLVVDRAPRPDSGRDYDLRHENAGARLLANWFGSEVTEPVKLHVIAKRYLATLDVGYAATLAYPAKPLDPAELAAFERSPHFDDAVTLRRWDDQARLPGAPTPPLDVFHNLIVELLVA